MPPIRGRAQFGVPGVVRVWRDRKRRRSLCISLPGRSLWLCVSVADNLW